MCDGLDHVFRCKHISLQDKQKLVLGGPLGKKNSLAQKPKPLQGRKKEELQVELEGEWIMKDANRMLKLDLEKELATELHGVLYVCQHYLASHQLIQLRLISGDSSNAEDEESIFNAIKGIIKSTSNNKALATCMWSQIYYRDFKLEKKMEVEQAQQQSSRTTSVSLLQKPPTIRQHH